MPPTRIFLDWDRPLLPQAADRLVRHYARDGTADLRDVTVVLPGGRARRRLVELLLETAEARGLTLIPPESVTVGGLPDRLMDVPRRLAEPVASRRAWSRALRAVDADTLRAVFPSLPPADDMAAWDALAELLTSLHEAVAREGHRFTDVARMCGAEPGAGELLFDDAARWEVLAAIRGRYLDELDRAGLLDRHELRIAALSRGVPPRTDDVWLISVVDLPAVARGLLEASGAPVYVVVHAPEALSAPAAEGEVAAFDAHGLPVTEYWGEVDVPVSDEVLRVVDRPVNQADAVVEALEDLGGRYAAEDVTVSVHHDTDVVPFLEQRLEARGVRSRYAAGTPLAHAGPMRLLRAVADFVEDQAYEGLAALLRHPDAGPLMGRQGEGRARLQAIDAADRFYVDHLPLRIGGTMPRSRGRAAGLAPVVRALTDAGPLARLAGRKRLSRWMPDVLAVLQAAYEGRALDRGRMADRQLLDVLLRIRSAALALASLPDALDEPCTAPVAIRALLLELRGEALPPEARRDALELLDWLEIPLDDAPVAVLTGFNEGFLPESTVGHPFLPDGLRTCLGMADNRRRIARDAYRLTTVLRSREVVRLIAGRRSSTGDPLRPSRLMFRTSDDEVARRVLAFFGDQDAAPRRPSLASLGLTPARESGFQVPPEPTLTLEPHQIPSPLSVTMFRAFLADPYRFVLERILKLRGMNDDAREMDPMVFGTLAHAVLQSFGAAVLDGDGHIDVTDPEAVRDLLFALLDREVEARFGDSALPAVSLQARQLRMRMETFAEAQAAWAREGWRIAAVEQGPAAEGVPFEVDDRPVFLGGRIDRIDHHPETGRWAVLDYKTGNELDHPDRAHRKRRGKESQWVDLQLPLYRTLVSGLVDAEGRPLVDPEAVREGRVLLGYVGLPRDAAPSAFLMADWTEEDLAEAEEVARGVVRALRVGRFEFDAAVTKPMRHGSDALEPLITRGWQAPDDGSDGSGPDEDSGGGS